MSTNLRFGNALITTPYCETCKQETYHRRGACIHCKTVRPLAPVWQPKYHNTISRRRKR